MIVYLSRRRGLQASLMDFRSGRPRSWAARPAWEDPDPESDEEAPDPDSDPDPRVPWRDSDAESADDNSDASDEPEPTPGQQFVDHMLELYFCCAKSLPRTRAWHAIMPA